MGKEGEREMKSLFCNPSRGRIKRSLHSLSVRGKEAIYI